MFRRARAFGIAIATALGLVAIYVYANLADILAWWASLAGGQVVTDVGWLGTGVAIASAGIKVYSNWTQANFRNKAKRELGLRRLWRDLFALSNLLDAYSPEQITTLLRGMDTLPPAMQAAVQALARALHLTPVAPPPLAPVTLTPAEAEALSAEIDILFALVVQKIDLALVKEDMDKVAALRAKILARFHAPLERQRARERLLLTKQEQDVIRTRERLAQLLSMQDPEG
jgi:hypothetical protein